MRVLVTGSGGHLGEALLRTLRERGADVIGLDLKPTAFTERVGSIIDRAFVKQCLRGVHTVVHAATLHKPHIATHARQDFIDTNITGTLNLLEEAIVAGVKSFVFTSTTSVFGQALTPSSAEPAAWITEAVTPIPKNIYGITKLAAEHLCELFHQKHKLHCIVLRTSRFFPDEDDDREVRQVYEDANLKVNEFLYRRADIEDVVSAHLLAIEKAPAVKFGRYIISATTPFASDDVRELRMNTAAVVERYVPEYRHEYDRRGWRMVPAIDRIYVNALARTQLGWQPKHDFQYILGRLRANEDYRSPLAQTVGWKGYHEKSFEDGPYPVE